LLALPSAASAQDTKGLVHKVTDQGEGYADIAEHYYGRRYLERHLRLFNRRPEPLERGTLINLPTSRSVIAKRGDTWEELAKTHLLDARRADYLAELLGGSKPRPGTAVPIVSSINHVVRPGESLRSIARLYYRDAGNKRIKLLVLYNKLPNEKVKKSVRIPLDGGEFDRDAVVAKSRQTFSVRPLVAEKSEPLQKKARPNGGGERPKKVDSKRLEESVEEAERLYEEGEFERCVVFTRAELAAAPDGTSEPKVELLRVEAQALVALGRYPESRIRFKELLLLDPKYELDLYRTSPKILDVFEAVAER
jgi:hypothetical protein